MKEFNEEQLILTRGEYNKFKIMGEKKFTALQLNSAVAIFQQKMNTYFEELSCVGYNPSRRVLAVQ